MTADIITGTDYEKRILDDRVHGSLYYDPRIFEEELERIFHREWVYVGHESEVPESGDYHLKKIGLQPVIMTRGKNGGVHLLLNRCAHRANQLCHSESGNSSHFRCPYHGWTFKNNGDLTGAPYRGGYDGSLNKEEFGLGKARRASYRGFVFGRMAEDGISLEEHLGEHGLEAIDRLCDLSPEGEVEISAGWMKHYTRANWKMMTENEVDGYHPLFVHRSLFEAVEGTTMEEVFQDKGISVVRDLGGGHTEIDMRPEYRELGKKLAWFGAKESSVSNYIEAMEEKYGEEEAHQKLVDGPPHVMIFPNLFLAEMNILNLQPVSVNETIQYQTPVLLRGAPEMNKRILRNTEGAMGPAGALIADDSEMYERNQQGLEARMPEWLLLSRGMHREEVLEDGSRVSHHTDETTQRAIWRHYKKVMRDA